MRSNKKQKEDLLTKRQGQLRIVTEALEHIEEQRRDLIELLNEHKLLDSASAGMYLEIDKLCKKAPAESVTELMLNQINDVVTETKALITNDRYIAKLKPFVPAGDNPQLRDALIVMRQIRQGLERYEKQYQQNKDELDQQMSEASVFRYALQYYIETNEVPEIKSIKRRLGSLIDIPSQWRTESGVMDFDYEPLFDFDYLDAINLHQYFDLNE